MDMQTIVITLIVYFGAIGWNLLNARLAPARVPGTVIGCIMWAIAEAIVVTLLVTGVQAVTGRSGDTSVIENALRYGLIWAIASAFLKNNSRSYQKERKAKADPARDQENR